MVRRGLRAGNGGPSAELSGLAAPVEFGDGRLVPFAAGIWTATTPIRFVGNWFPHVMFLRRRRKSIVDRAIDGATQTPWSSQIPHVTLRGLLTFNESVFYHRATRTLIVTDLLMNAAATAATPAITKLGYRFFGLNGDLVVFPVLRWFGLTSRGSLRELARQVAQWNPERHIVAHGTPVTQGAALQLRDAFGYLKP